MSGVKGMRKLDVENWVNTAAFPDKIMGFREILRAAYALGVIDDFTYESQLRVKTLLDYNRRAHWLMNGAWMRIPTIATTCSGGRRPPIPTDRDHPFRRIATRLRTVMTRPVG